MNLKGKIVGGGVMAVLRSFFSLGGLKNEYFDITQTKLDIQVIADAANSSDLVAFSVLQVLDDRIGRSTAAIINMFDPNVNIFGRRFAKLSRLYLNVPRKWSGYLLIENSVTQLTRATEDPFALARGSARIAAVK